MRRFLAAVLRRVDAAPAGVADVARCAQRVAFGDQDREGVFERARRVGLKQQDRTLRVFLVAYQHQGRLVAEAGGIVIEVAMGDHGEFGAGAERILRQYRACAIFEAHGQAIDIGLLLDIELAAVDRELLGDRMRMRPLVDGGTGGGRFSARTPATTRRQHRDNPYGHHSHELHDPLPKAVAGWRPMVEHSDRHLRGMDREALIRFPISPLHEQSSPLYRPHGMERDKGPEADTEAQDPAYLRAAPGADSGNPLRMRSMTACTRRLDCRGTSAEDNRPAAMSSETDWISNSKPFPLRPS